MKDMSLFRLKLGEEYYTNGIIYFPTKYKDILSKESGIQVKVFLADAKRTILGTFTVSGDKRIVNGHDDLKDWYKKNFIQGESVLVEIKSEILFELSKIK